MPDILLELFSEEIPARMQVAAMEHLKKVITNGLVDVGLCYDYANSFVTPRRLALHVVNVPIATKPMIFERKGPRVGAPEAAIQGFLKAAGLENIEQAHLQDDGKGGQFYLARTQKTGLSTAKILKSLIEKTILEFPWPKSMRWGSGSLTWVRPLHNVCCTFSSDTEIEAIEVELENVTNKTETTGHVFLSPISFSVKRYDDYIEKLEQNYVVLDRERRKDIIKNDAKNISFAQNLEVIPDESLLEEVAGLVEYPVVLIGSFDNSFLNIPERVIQTTIRVNQKCFVLRSLSNGCLSNNFIIVSNLAAPDGGAAIIAGNERVIQARLSDANFFWENDQKIKMQDRLSTLKNVVFHELLGTQFERVERIKAISGKIIQKINPLLKAHVDLAASLAKVDLLTEMVGEFPELQGYMGRKYAELEGLPTDVCIAIEDHYKPRGPNENVPSNIIAAIISIAEKIDLLVGFWSISEKPTGSKDPFALRRAAIGLVRILEHYENFPFSVSDIINFGAEEHKKFNDHDDLKMFILERLRVQLIEIGFMHDHVAGILAVNNDNNIAPIKQYLHILKGNQALLANILSGFKRANNILKAEKHIFNFGSFEEWISADGVLNEDLEIKNILNLHISEFGLEVVPLEYYESALKNISEMSKAIYAYVENTLINDPIPEIRLYRMRLLVNFIRVTNTLANFEKFEG